MKNKITALVLAGIMIITIMGGCGMTQGSRYKLSVSKDDPNYIAMKAVMPSVGEPIQFQDISEVDDNGNAITVNGAIGEQFEEYGRRQADDNQAMIAYSEQHWLDIQTKMQDYVKKKYGLTDMQLIYADAPYPYDCLDISVKHTTYPVFVVPMQYSPADNGSYGGVGFSGDDDNFNDQWVSSYVAYAYQDEFADLTKFFADRGMIPSEERFNLLGGLHGTPIVQATFGNMTDQKWVPDLLAYAKANPNATPNEMKTELTTLGFNGSSHDFMLEVQQKDTTQPLTQEGLTQMESDLQTFINQPKYDAIFVGTWNCYINTMVYSHYSGHGPSGTYSKLGNLDEMKRT